MRKKDNKKEKENKKKLKWQRKDPKKMPKKLLKNNKKYKKSHQNLLLDNKPTLHLSKLFLLLNFRKYKRHKNKYQLRHLQLLIM